MFVSGVELIVDKKKADLEASLKAAQNLDTFDIEDLDGNDIRKSVLVAFSELVDLRFLDEILKDVIGEEIDSGPIE
ncbi:unnamed protein product [marine sediment metagenome]|uniref:Uncharacterized protein n=1 Tax=marine sediment metagenome TaxID=412755 RepID=X0TAY1_9ZZZZ